MNLYHLVFERSPFAGLIVRTLGLDPGDFGRFRDAFVAKGEIVVYTRLGGGNRPDYEREFQRMAAHPLFLREEDDAFDNTYCTFFFSLPEAHAEFLRKHDTGEPWDPSKRWADALERMKKEGPPKSAIPLVNALKRAVGKGEP